MLVTFSSAVPSMVHLKVLGRPSVDYASNIPRSSNLSSSFVTSVPSWDPALPHGIGSLGAGRAQNASVRIDPLPCTGLHGMREWALSNTEEIALSILECGSTSGRVDLLVRVVYMSASFLAPRVGGWS